MHHAVDTDASPRRRSLDIFFAQSVASRPDRPALFVAGERWTYRQLDARARSIERTLDDAGLRDRHSNVGLIYGRSVFSYAAVLAIMGSNNIYVPLNPKLPPERLSRVIADAGIDTILVDTSEPASAGSLRSLRELPGVRVIQPDDIGADETPATLSNRADTPATELAYIIYTSGSTGIPKGVAISHESGCRCIEKLQDMFDTRETDRFTQFSALSFDVSIADLFLCWKSGGTLYVPDASEALVALKFAATHEITVWSSVPSLANFLVKLRLLKPGCLPSIRLSMFAGEALPAELAHAWMIAAPGSRVFNIYGPTECTVFATYHEYRSADAQAGVVPIGMPLAGLTALVVSDGCVVEAQDEPGELWISGDQVAVGYWNNPTATDAAFVSFPANDPAAKRWYRTGDLVSRSDGIGLTFRGRLDRQVKLRGFRVELQEVESVLREVSGCAVVAVVPIKGAGGLCEKLIAFCEDPQADEASIKAGCMRRVPAYMVPERIVGLERIPLSEHGKVDYLALAARRS